MKPGAFGVWKWEHIDNHGDGRADDDDDEMMMMMAMMMVMIYDSWFMIHDDDDDDDGDDVMMMMILILMMMIMMITITMVWIFEYQSICYRLKLWVYESMAYDFWPMTWDEILKPSKQQLMSTPD